MSYTQVIVVTVLGGLVGIALWISLKWSSISFHRLFVIVVMIGIVCRVAFALFTPSFYAPDEQGHFNYVKYIYQNGRFPIQDKEIAAGTSEKEYYQPPLYYLISAPLYGMSDHLFKANHHFAVRTIRLLSIVLWLLNIVFALKILDNLGIDDMFIKTLVFGILCLLPTYAFLSSVINNDNLAITFGGAILFLLSKKRSYGRSALIGLLLGLALLTKLTAVIYLFAITAVLFTQWVRKFSSFSSASAHFALIVILAAFIWSPWMLRNLNLYGDITAEKIGNIPAQWPSVFHAIKSTLIYMKNSFWAVSGIHNNIMFLPTAGIHLIYFGVVGLLYGLFSRNELLLDVLKDHNAVFMIAMTAAIAVNIVLVLRFGVLYGQGQGRFLFPMLIPISLFTAIGIKLLGVTNYSKSAHVHALGFLVTHCVSFTAFSLGRFTQV